MIKWKTSRYGTEIKPVEIVRETDKCVFIQRRMGGEYRESKDSRYIIYHDTWEDAKSRLTSYADGEVEAAKRSLDYALKRQVEIAAMTKPEGVQ